MELYAVESGPDLDGYFVLAFAPGQARLVDCWARDDDDACWGAVVQLAVAEAQRRPGVAELVALASDSRLADALQRCGFHARGSRPLYVRVARGIEPPAQSVRIQMIDNDSAYLHNGARRYWA